ncbi:MAG TPA: insulinase family protein [Fimbriimonas sp.]|nr:insulinase family protein [Fimbriimonas sp.]
MLLAAHLTQVQVADSPQLRTLLPNESIVFVDRRDTPYASIQLVLGTKGLSETPATYGYRHLLEHLVARSIPGHDFELESQGGALYAFTSRDWIRFEWRVPPELVPTALSGIAKMLRPKVFTKEQIAKEAAIIGLERKQMASVDRVSVEVWSHIFGADGLDAMGTAESVASATPEQLTDTWRTITRSNNVVISASGPLEIKPFTEAASAITKGLASNNGQRMPRKPVGNYAGDSVLGIALQSIEREATAATLIAVFGIATNVPNAFVTLTPTSAGGVLLLGSLNGKLPRTAASKDTDPTIYNRGKQLAIEWIDSKLTTPEGVAEFNGTLLSLSPSIRPRKLRENFQQVPYEIVQKSISDLKEMLQ